MEPNFIVSIFIIRDIMSISRTIVTSLEAWWTLASSYFYQLRKSW